MISARKLEHESHQLVSLAITLSELESEEETIKKEIADLERGGSIDVEVYHRLWKAARAKQDHLGRRILEARSRMERLLSSLDAGLTALASPARKAV